MMLPFFSGLIHLRHVSFSEGIHRVLAGAVNVNDGRVKVPPLAIEERCTFEQPAEVLFCDVTALPCREFGLCIVLHA
jgi:hypothetical protein